MYIRVRVRTRYMICFSFWVLSEASFRYGMLLGIPLGIKFSLSFRCYPNRDFGDEYCTRSRLVRCTYILLGVSHSSGATALCYVLRCCCRISPVSAFFESFKFKLSSRLSPSLHLRSVRISRRGGRTFVLTPVRVGSFPFNLVGSVCCVMFTAAGMCKSSYTQSDNG